MPVPISLFTRRSYNIQDNNDARVVAENARALEKGRPIIHATVSNRYSNPLPEAHRRCSGAATRHRRAQEAHQLASECRNLSEQVQGLREQNATLTYTLGCSEKRVACLTTLNAQLFVLAGDSASEKYAAQMSLAVTSDELAARTNDLAATARGLETLKAQLAASESSASERLAAKDREIADLQAKLKSQCAHISGLSTQLIIRDEDIRSLKANLVAAQVAAEAAATKAASDAAAAQAAREQEVACLEAELASLNDEAEGSFWHIRRVISEWYHTDKARQEFHAAYLLMQDDISKYQDSRISCVLGREPDPASRKADAAALSEQTAARCPLADPDSNAIIQARAWMLAIREKVYPRLDAAAKVASSTAAAGGGDAGCIVSK